MNEADFLIKARRFQVVLQSVDECVARVAKLVAESQARIARSRVNAHPAGISAPMGYPDRAAIAPTRLCASINHSHMAAQNPPSRRPR